MRTQYPEARDLSVTCEKCGGDGLADDDIYCTHCDATGRIPAPPYSEFRRWMDEHNAPAQLNWPFIRAFALYVLFLGVVVWYGYHVFGGKP